MIELEFRNVDIYEGRKTGEPGEKPSKQGRESTTNSTHMKYPSRGSNPRPIGTTAVRGERITATPPMLPKYAVTLKWLPIVFVRLIQSQRIVTVMVKFHNNKFAHM
jgi:hypothetical protein